jgi:predicted ATPase
MDHEKFVVISGCSGGGKSTLLAELARRGHAVVEEPGRRIVIEELKTGGSALPWLDMKAFVQRAVAVSLADLAAAGANSGWVFFDRGLIDAAVALEHESGEPVERSQRGPLRFNPRVFLTPPWPEIYVRDEERRHDWDEAVAEYNRLLHAYPKLGYEVVLVPKVDVAERAEFVLQTLES